MMGPIVVTRLIVEKEAQAINKVNDQPSENNLNDVTMDWGADCSTILEDTAATIPYDRCVHHDANKHMEIIPYTLRQLKYRAKLSTVTFAPASVSNRDNTINSTKHLSQILTKPDQLLPMGDSYQHLTISRLLTTWQKTSIITNN